MSPGSAYEAVSYVWGPSQPAYTITVDGRGCEVRENLWLFLKRYRHPEHVVILWIDALCIDQSNTLERNHQVQLMGSIYQTASRTAVWLGAEDDASVRSMSLIHRAKTIHGSDFEEIETSEALAGWARREYWFRTWVVQEFLLAKDVIVLCGTSQVSWSELDLFCQKVDSNIQRLPFFAQSRAHRLIKQRSSRDFRKKPLFQLVLENGDTRCEDTRDKIYAMLALAGTEDHPSVAVDYNRSRTELFLDALRVWAPPPSRLFGCATFLARLLCLESTQLGKWIQKNTSRPSEPERLVFKSSGFNTGRIVSCDVIFELEQFTHASADLSKTLQDLGISLPRPSRDTHTHTSADLKDCLDRLISLQLRQFYISTPLLREINDQNVHHADTAVSEKNTMQKSDHDRPMVSLVVVYFHGIFQQPFVLGLTCGRVTKGDEVLQFLGHEAGFVFRGSTGGPQSLVGRISCVAPGGSWTDPETLQRFDCYGLQSASLCNYPVIEQQLQITCEQLLWLVCPSSKDKK